MYSDKAVSTEYEISQTISLPATQIVELEKKHMCVYELVIVFH